MRMPILVRAMIARGHVPRWGGVASARDLFRGGRFVAAALIASPTFAVWLKARGLLTTPEEVSPDPLLTRAKAAFADFDLSEESALHRLRADATLRAGHLANLPAMERKRGDIDPHLATAMAKIDDADTFDEAVGFLDQRETFALLGSSCGLQRMMAKP
jgi:membrane glycosyltransferase